VKQSLAYRIPEPVVLGAGQPSPFCKTALLDGPYQAKVATSKKQVFVGLVGPKTLCDSVGRWLRGCRQPIPSLPTRNDGKPANTLLFPDYPGSVTAFRTEFVTDEAHAREIRVAELAKLDTDDRKRFQQLVDLYWQKMESVLTGSDSHPDVIICVLDNDMFERCHLVGDSHKRLPRRRRRSAQMDLFSDFDRLRPERASDSRVRNLRSALKRAAMGLSTPTPIQLVLQDTTVDSPGGQNQATKAWNLCTALYYKAGQIPWVVSGVESTTCFMGIGHFHRRTDTADDVCTSVAHLFSNDFEGIVLHGTEMRSDEATGEPYLDKTGASLLLRQGLGRYRDQRGYLPKRVVIHKTSSFRADEVDGYVSVLHELGCEYDLVTLAKSGLRLLREGKYPVARGTCWEMEGLQFVYTKGFVPELNTYPGVHVPAPFLVTKAAGDSSMDQLCREVLALSKMNWNTADYCTGLPVTIGFAQRVGDVFKEFEAEDKVQPQTSYRFYM
jgi:hypothetical protein